MSIQFLTTFVAVLILIIGALAIWVYLERKQYHELVTAYGRLSSRYDLQTKNIHEIRRDYFANLSAVKQSEHCHVLTARLIAYWEMIKLIRNKEYSSPEALFLLSHLIEVAEKLSEQIRELQSSN